MDSLYCQTVESLKTWLAEQGEKPFRAGQILSWPFKSGVERYDQFRNVPQTLQQKLAAAFSLRTVATRDVQDSAWATKLLLELSDGETIECVLLKDDRGHRTVCLSTQVGCAMGCLFCATGQTRSGKTALPMVSQSESLQDEPSPLGRCFVRNLTADEIIQQVLCFQDRLPEGERISNLVVMGMGEPTQNLDNLLPALDILSDKLEIGARKITISTVGIPAGIRRIAEYPRQYHLAISLHAPNDELRNRIVPANRNIGLGATIQAADEFFDLCGRRVTYEYVLLGSTNDSTDCADQLARLLHGKNALVNVIPYNEVRGLPFKKPLPKTIDLFVQTLEARGIQVHLRKEKGGKIDAACGQLRRKNIQNT